MFQARRRQWTGQVACMGRKRNNWHRILVEKCEGGKLLERPMDRWNDNIKMYLKELELQNTYWIYLSQGWD